MTTDTTVTNKKPNLPPAGYYKAFPQKLQWSSTKNDEPRFSLGFKIAEGEYKDFVVHKSGLVTSDEHYDWLGENLRTCGWKGTDVTRVTLDQETPVRIQIKNRSYQDSKGEWRNIAEVRYVNKIDGNGPKPVAESVMDRVRAKMKSRICDVDAKSGFTPEKEKPVTQAAPAKEQTVNRTDSQETPPGDDFPLSDDEIPF